MSGRSRPRSGQRALATGASSWHADELTRALRTAPRGSEPDWSERAPERLAEQAEERAQVAAEQDAVRRLAGRCNSCGHEEFDHVEVWSVDTRFEATLLGEDRNTPTVIVCTVERCFCTKAVEP